MKKIAFTAVISALAVLMLLPLIRGVNHPANNAVGIVADGWPQPPFPPGTLVADGWPQPPFPPGTLVADGWPQPPFPPGTLVAETPLVA